MLLYFISIILFMSLILFPIILLSQASVHALLEVK